MSTGIETILRHYAVKHDLPGHLVVAMARVESSLNTWAHRAEPSYRWLWDTRRHVAYRPSLQQAAAKLPPTGFPAPAGISPLSEWQAQQASWGLMQVMGATARELGLTGPIPQLLDPTMGADFGCRYLATLRRRFLIDHGWRGVVQAYNTGHPNSANDYPKKVASYGTGGVLT